MFQDGHNAWGTVCQCVGKRISSLYRVQTYNFFSGETREENNGELQINFADGQVLLLDGAGAQSLKAENVPWIDPFAEKAQAFQVYLGESHGWWTRLVDVSRKEHYSDAISRVIQAVYPIVTDNNWLSGAQFVIEDQRLNFFYSGIGCRVRWGDVGPELKDDRLTVNDEFGCTR